MKPVALILQFILISGFGLHAADWRIPITGVVLDPVSQSLRPIQGLPGASLLGPPLGLPFAVRHASILGMRNAAIAMDDAGQAWLVTGLLAGDLAAKPLEGAIDRVDRIAANNAGSVAVLYGKSGSRIQFVRGLPDNPSVSEPVSLTNVHGEVSAMAVSEDGGWALIGAADSGQGAVYRVGPATNDEPLLVTSAVDPRAILITGQDALIADYGIDEVLLIQDVAGAHERILFANGPGGVSGPVALQVLDDKSVLIANAGSQTIGRVDSVTWQMVQIPVSAMPDRLEKLLQPNVFALNAPNGAPLLLLDASAEIRIVFVPQER